MKFVSKNICQPTSHLLLPGPIPAELGDLAALKELILTVNKLCGESQWANPVSFPDQIRYDSSVCAVV